MATNEETSWLWHRRLGHASMSVISKLVRKDLVVGLPKLSFEMTKCVMHVLKENIEELHSNL